MIEVNNRIIDTIEDFACVSQTIDQIVTALDNNLPMPNYIPVLHDTLMTDHLSRICETLNKRRNG